MVAQLIIALVVTLLITGLASWRGSLSTSGAWGAILVGTFIIGLGGWQWGILLGAFFVTSSLLSHFKEEEKKAVAEKFDKGNQRDLGQVIANGGIGTLAAILSVLYETPFWFPFFIGVMATVTADTWATELGTLSRHPPRLITTGRIVPVGTSGGISLMGTAISATGGLFIGLLAGLITENRVITMVIAGALAGLIGSLSDSLLGATIQQISYCHVCQKETEKKQHCSQLTQPIRGFSWMNNDLVNLIASLIGGITAVWLLSFL